MSPFFIYHHTYAISVGVYFSAYFCKIKSSEAFFYLSPIDKKLVYA
jgi:hypothetical protein